MSHSKGDATHIEGLELRVPHNSIVLLDQDKTGRTKEMLWMVDTPIRTVVA